MDTLPHVPPFRWVDKILDRDPPRRCVVLKIFSAGESLLRDVEEVPFPLVVESLCQAAAFLHAEPPTQEGRIAALEEVEMTGPVRPGDRLVITVGLLEEGTEAMKAESRGEVEGRMVARLRVLILKK